MGVVRMPEIDAASAEAPVKSKYTFIDTAEGFLVQRDGGLELPVMYGETYIRAGTSVGIYQYPKLVDAVADWFLDRLIPGYINKRKREEGTAMIAWAIAKRMKPHWERLVKAIVPKEVANLARLMWSSVHGDADILHRPELYTEEHAYLRGDLMRYHACRLIAKREEATGIVDGQTPLQRAAQWRTLYADNAVSPKALNQTLDKLPRALSFHSIDKLTNVHIEQPITNRLHLIAVLCGADHYHWYMHERTLLRASGEMIQDAAAAAGMTLKKASKTRHIQAAVQYILDYPAPFNGDFLGLARRSAEWHRDNRILPESDRLSADTALPLLNLDYDKLAEAGVKPLRTVGEVVQEGDHMGHCVGSYAHRASVGHSFLFHVDYANFEATIELLSNGAVCQAYGPHNTINGACAWGSERLREAVRIADVVKIVPAIPF